MEKKNRTKIVFRFIYILQRLKIKIFKIIFLLLNIIYYFFWKIKSK